MTNVAQFLKRILRIRNLITNYFVLSVVKDVNRATDSNNIAAHNLFQEEVNIFLAST